MKKENFRAMYLMGFVFFSFLGIVSAMSSSFILPQESLGNKTITLELGKPLVWSSEQDLSLLKVQSIQNDTVVFSLKFSEQTYRFLLAPGQSFGIDIDRDSLPDGSITLTSLETNRVKVLLNSNAQQNTLPEKTPPTLSSEKNNAPFFFVGISFLVLIILFILIYMIWIWARARNEIPSLSVNNPPLQATSESSVKTENAFSK